MKNITQFLITAGVGAVAGNGIARHTPLKRPFCLKHDAIPLTVGTAIPSIISMAVPLQPTLLKLLGTAIAGAWIAYLMTPNPVTEHKKTDNHKKEESMKTTRPTGTPTKQQASKNTHPPSIRLRQPETHNNTNSAPATEDNSNLTEQVTAQSTPIPPQATPTQQNNISNPVRTQNVPHKYWPARITDFFPNPFATQEPKEKKPVPLTEYEKDLQKTKDRKAKSQKEAEERKVAEEKEKTEQKAREEKERAEQKAREEKERAERAKMLKEKFGLTEEECEKKLLEEEAKAERAKMLKTIKSPKISAQQEAKETLERLLKNLDDDLKPYLPAENYHNLRDNINRELREKLNLDAPDTHDYEKIFAAGHAYDIQYFVGAYHKYKPDEHQEFKEEYSEFFNNPDIMGLAKDIAKTIENTKKVSEYTKLPYDLKQKCEKINRDIQPYVEYLFKNDIDKSAPKRLLTIKESDISKYHFEEMKKNSEAFTEIMNKLEADPLDSIKALSPEIKKTMLDKCDTHERKPFVKMFKKIVACVTFDKPVDERWDYSQYDIKYHHDRYIGNTLKIPQEKQRLDRIEAYLAEFEKISQDPTIFSVADMSSFKIFCQEQKFNLWDSSYNQDPPENKTEYTFDDIKNTQNPLEKLKKIILQASHEGKRFNKAYSDINGKENSDRIKNLYAENIRRNNEYWAWKRAEDERKQREQQQNTGNTSQSGSQQQQYPNRNIPEATKEDMFIDSLEHKAIDTVNKYLKDNAKPLNVILQEILPHKTSSNETDYDTKQKTAYRAIMRLIHNDKISKLDIPESKKTEMENALKVFSQMINRLNNINYHFQKRKD